MSNIDFYTQYVRPAKEKFLERNSGEKLIERQGYVPAKKKIEGMILAGQRLVQVRNDQYDFDGDVPDDYADPTRDRDFDQLDAMDFAEQSKATIEAANQYLKEVADATETKAMVDKQSSERSGEEDDAGSHTADDPQVSDGVAEPTS